MKRIISVIILPILALFMLAGCSSPASLKDLQGDLAMYNSTNSQFKLPDNLNALYDRNNKLLNGNWTKDSPEFLEVEKNMPKLAGDCINIIL